MDIMVAEQQFQDFLDENDGTIIVAGIEFNASTILRELDPIAYNQAFQEYCDFMEIDLDGEDEEQDVSESQEWHDFDPDC